MTASSGRFIMSPNLKSTVEARNKSPQTVNWKKRKEP